MSMQIERYRSLKALVQSDQSLHCAMGNRSLRPLIPKSGYSRTRIRLEWNLIEAAGGSAVQVQRAVDRSGKTSKVEGAGAGQMYLASGTASLLTQAEQLSHKGRRQISVTLVHICAGARAGERH